MIDKQRALEALAYITGLLRGLTVGRTDIDFQPHVDVLREFITEGEVAVAMKDNEPIPRSSTWSNGELTKGACPVHFPMGVPCSCKAGGRVRSTDTGQILDILKLRQ